MDSFLFQVRRVENIRPPTCKSCDIAQTFNREVQHMEIFFFFTVIFFYALRTADLLRRFQLRSERKHAESIEVFTEVNSS